MDNKSPVDFLAEKIIKYSNVDYDKVQINLSVPFKIWEEWYYESKEVEEKYCNELKNKS